MEKLEHERAIVALKEHLARGAGDADAMKMKLHMLLDDKAETVELLSLDPTRVLATQAEVAKVPKVAEIAGKRAPGNVSPSTIAGETSVQPSGSADSLTFTVTDPNPQRAEAYARCHCPDWR